MAVNFLNVKCIQCLVNKSIADLPDVSEEKKVAYIKRVLSVIASAAESSSAPEAVEEITKAQREILGTVKDYSEEKKYYNDLLLSVKDDINEKIISGTDPFVSAMNYSFAGNYIDFGTVNGVDREKLINLLDSAGDISVSPTETENLRRELKGAKRLVYLIDNCGEVVLDRLFIEEIKRQNPRLDVTVITRGAPVLNDCTIEDAYSVGLDLVAHIVSNGTAVAGTCLDRIASAAREAIDNADVIISKGQGNFETLIGCKKNVYYLFLCKCEKFSDRFGVKNMSAMLVNDKRLEL